MNQWLADLFFSLPRGLTAPHIFGTLCLLFSWLCYFFNIRPLIVRRIQKRCTPAYRKEHLCAVRARILYGKARKKAGLDEGGAYLFHLLSLLLLICATVLHGALFAFCLAGEVVAVAVDNVALTVTVCCICALSLALQPASTMDRRTRWGFRRPGNIVRAVLREGVIVAVLFLWIYDAYFFPALL